MSTSLAILMAPSRSCRLLLIKSLPPRGHDRATIHLEELDSLPGSHQSNRQMPDYCITEPISIT